MNPFENDLQMKEYFDNLPIFVQQNIVQSGMQADNLEQLKAVAEQILNGKSRGE